MAPYLDSSSNNNHNDASGTWGKTKLLQVHSTGTPYKIGYQHGIQAADRVMGTIAFYTEMFQKTTGMDWERVREVAMMFEPSIRAKWPEYLEEMKGLAEGAGVTLPDILAINVRTEIAFGLFSDGCTALSWTTEDESFLAQNWDWQEAQKGNLILLTIEQQAQSKPTIKMVTEAGIIGKIGLNSEGVGVCLNAIKMRGMDPARLPCHLGLRMVLDSMSRAEAVEKLERHGIASACHFLVADEAGGVGLEWSSADCQECTMNAEGQVFHSNHYLKQHPETGQDMNWWKDSTYRVTRIEELANQIQGQPTTENIFELFKDETNMPGAICRVQKGTSEAATLFNIVMDLKAKRARVRLGRPTEPEETVDLVFEDESV